MNSPRGRIVKQMQLVFAISLGLGPGRAIAETIRVPADHPTIQGAIEAACDGDTIIVSPGTYCEIINFLGKAITVRSTNPYNPSIVPATIIEGTVTFSPGEGPSGTLCGLTIRGPEGNAAIRSVSSSPTVANCIIPYYGFGHAIDCAGGAPTFVNSRIELMRPDTHQQLVRCVDTLATFTDCRIGVGEGDTYNLDGSHQPGVNTFVEFNPERSNGAVYSVEDGRMIPTRRARAGRRGNERAPRVRRPSRHRRPRSNHRFLEPTRLEAPPPQVKPDLPNPKPMCATCWSSPCLCYQKQIWSPPARWCWPRGGLPSRPWKLHPTAADPSLPYIAPHLLNPGSRPCLP